MSDYIITLTDDQDVALQYEVEEANRHAQAIGAAGYVTAPPWTPTTLLEWRIGTNLDATYQQIQGTLTTVDSMLAQTPADQHAMLIDAVASPAIRAYVRAKWLRQ